MTPTSDWIEQRPLRSYAAPSRIPSGSSARVVDMPVEHRHSARSDTSQISARICWISAINR